MLAQQFTNRQDNHIHYLVLTRQPGLIQGQTQLQEAPGSRLPLSCPVPARQWHRPGQGAPKEKKASSGARLLGHLIIPSPRRSQGPIGFS